MGNVIKGQLLPGLAIAGGRTVWMISGCPPL